MENSLISVTLLETIFFSLINIIIILLAIILWYSIWIKNYGGSIPNKQYSEDEEMTYFNSKNFVIVIDELWKRIRTFDTNYLIPAIGMEATTYLNFQRNIISLVLIMSIFSILISFITNIFNYEEKGYTIIEEFLLNNRNLTEYSTIMHLIAMTITTFLHFRFFSTIKTESKYMYFDRFDKMSRNKNYQWLSCRTLHISGLGANERNSIIIIF